MNTKDKAHSRALTKLRADAKSSAAQASVMWLCHNGGQMDLQTYLTNAAKVARRVNFDQSDQLSLGELIARLEPIAKKQPARIEEDSKGATVIYDFEYLFPTKFDSWRGIYSELALNYTDYDRTGPLTVTAFLEMCKETIGKTFTGYKGGEYTMGKTTPVWVANHGNSGNTALVEVVDAGYQVILITGYRET